VDKGLKFWDLSRSTLMMASSPGWTLAKAYTICGWVHWRSYANANAHFPSWGTSSLSLIAGVMPDAPDAVVSPISVEGPFYYPGVHSKNGFEGVNNTLLDKEQWNMLCAASDGRSTTFYTATPKSKVIEMGTVQKAFPGLKVQSIGYEKDHQPGKVAMVKAWDGVLSKPEVEQVHKFSVHLVEPDLVQLKEYYGVDCTGTSKSVIEPFTGDLEDCKIQCLFAKGEKCSGFVRVGKVCTFLHGSVRKTHIPGAQFHGSCWRRGNSTEEPADVWNPGCVVHVQSVEHIGDAAAGRGSGMYFALSQADVERAMGRSVIQGDSIMVRHLRSHREEKVILWHGSGNQNDKPGFVHGRWLEKVYPGFWHVGDDIEILQDCKRFKMLLTNSTTGNKEGESLYNKTFGSLVDVDRSSTADEHKQMRSDARRGGRVSVTMMMIVMVGSAAIRQSIADMSGSPPFLAALVGAA